MKTLIGCETCIYGYLAIDGAGYYCKQPEYKKIECVKTKLAHYVARLETNKIADDDAKILNTIKKEGGSNDSKGTV